MAAPPVSPDVAPDDRRARAALGQHVVHQAREQLHGHVLERQRRPVEQLENEAVGSDLDQRRDGRVAEGGIGLVRHAPAVLRARCVARERVNDLNGDIGEAACRQRTG